MFSGDRFDDQAMFTARIERDGCSCDGILHESGDSRVVKRFGRGKDDVLRDVSAALELLLGIGETLGLEEKQADPSGKERDGEYSF